MFHCVVTEWAVKMTEAHTESHHLKMIKKLLSLSLFYEILLQPMLINGTKAKPSLSEKPSSFPIITQVIVILELFSFYLSPSSIKRMWKENILYHFLLRYLVNNGVLK